MSISLILIIVSVTAIVVLLIAFAFSLCAAAKQTDDVTDRAFIEMMQDERNITSGSAVVKEE